MRVLAHRNRRLRAEWRARSSFQGQFGTVAGTRLKIVTSTLQRQELHYDRRTEDSALASRPSVGPSSPHHDVAACEHDIGVRFNDKERFDINESCISEGWVKVPTDKTVDRFVAPNRAT